MNKKNKNILKLPCLTLIGGIILRIIEFIAIRIRIATIDPNAEWGSEIFYVNLVSSIIIIFIIGMILRKTYDKDIIFKSATLLVIYSFVIWGLSEIGAIFGIYSLFSILYLPTEIFNMISSVLIEIISPQNMILFYLIVFIEKFAPYLFLLFTKKTESVK